MLRDIEIPMRQTRDAHDQERHGHDIKDRQNPALQLVAPWLKIAARIADSRVWTAKRADSVLFGMRPFHARNQRAPVEHPRSKRFTGGGSDA